MSQDDLVVQMAPEMKPFPGMQALQDMDARALCDHPESELESLLQRASDRSCEQDLNSFLFDFVHLTPSSAGRRLA
eukprot:COSAG03_NODE_15144_length_440_cov_0.604106_1_plen_75_part_01